MKRIGFFLFLIIFTFCFVGCGAQETSDPTPDDMTHLGNYGLEVTNRMIVVASAAELKYEIREPYGDGCQTASDCLWDPDDKAFLIEKGKEELFWETWETLYCQDPKNPDCNPYGD